MAKMICLAFVLAVAGALQVGPRVSLAQVVTEGHENLEPAGAAATASISFPRDALEKLANLTQEDNLWILIPSNVSESQLHESDFSLFKLNTDELLDRMNGGGRSGGGGGGGDPTGVTGDWVRADGPSAGGQVEGAATSGRSRAGRKLNLFKNVLSKPQVSPLYLVNGTVCRFVNSQPVCTTLSTTGLFRGQNLGFPQQQGGFFPSNNNNLQQQQQQQSNQLLPNQRQLSPQQAQQGGQQFQQFRPSAVLDDEQLAVSVAADGNLTARAQNAPRPAGPAQGSRPTSYAVRRPPLGLLALGRPFRAG